MSKIIDEYLESIAAAGLPGIESPHSGTLPKKKKEKKVKKISEAEVAEFKLIARRSYEYMNGEERFEGNHHKRLMIDFDATIHRYSKRWHDGTVYDPPIKESVEMVNKLYDDFEICIYTARLSNHNESKDILTQIIRVKKWLDENQVKYDKITANKYPAEFYIDDRSLFDKDWKVIYNTVKKKANN